MKKEPFDYFAKLLAIILTYGFIWIVLTYGFICIIPKLYIPSEIKPVNVTPTNRVVYMNNTMITDTTNGTACDTVENCVIRIYKNGAKKISGLK